jgi:thiol-disulfide isomerase/thioredoxin
MKTSLLSLLFIGCSSLLWGQPAPDFTVTDSDGQQHQLYADHLDQGKTVVIKVFFTYCPPCNAIAPLLEPFYQSWGAGTADMEMISLSTRPDDLNAAVTAYKNLHGLSSPGVGADGGSVAAVTPYTNGTYGLFFGTPTFVVIAPDGTVNYNVRGPNQQATIAALDAAVAATGAVKPPLSYTAAGSVLLPSGDPLPQTALMLESSTDTIAISDASGQFAYTGLFEQGTTHYLTGSRNFNHRNGISTLDIVLISRHILGIDTLPSTLQLIAADVNGDGNITTLDLIFLRRLILGIDEVLPNGQLSWIFIDPNYQFVQPRKPFEEVYNGQAAKVPFNLQSPGPLDLLGVKVGDVDFSADPLE